MGKTKAEEREALAKIQEILSGLGDDSYVGKAFEGCVKQAEENICNDWMLSWKDRYLNEQAMNCKLSDRLSASEEYRVELVKQLNQKDDAIARLEDAKNQLRGELDQRDSSRQELLGRISDAKTEIGDLKQTILELKAKLYDMMTREEVKG